MTAKIRLEVEVTLSEDTVAMLDGPREVEERAKDAARRLFPANGVRLLSLALLEMREKS